MSKINILWVDSEHIEHFMPGIQRLRERDFDVETLTVVDLNQIVERCSDKHIFVIHPGTFTGVENLKDILECIRSKYKNIKIGLETNVFHENVKNLVDFYVIAPLSSSRLESLFRNVISKR